MELHALPPPHAWRQHGPFVLEHAELEVDSSGSAAVRGMHLCRAHLNALGRRVDRNASKHMPARRAAFCFLTPEDEAAARQAVDGVRRPQKCGRLRLRD